MGIPKNALKKDDQGTFVVIEAQGKAVNRNVKTGLVNGEWIEIIEGLAAGESLIVKGQGLSEGRGSDQDRSIENPFPVGKQEGELT